MLSKYIPMWVTWMAAGTSVPCMKLPVAASGAASSVGVVRACTSTTRRPEALACLDSTTCTALWPCSSRSKHAPSRGADSEIYGNVLCTCHACHQQRCFMWNDLLSGAASPWCLQHSVCCYRNVLVCHIHISSAGGYEKMVPLQQRKGQWPHCLLPYFCFLAAIQSRQPAHDP